MPVGIFHRRAALEQGPAAGVERLYLAPVADFDGRVVQDAGELADIIGELLDRPEQAAELGCNAIAVLEENRGALARLLSLLEPHLAA